MDSREKHLVDLKVWYNTVVTFGDGEYVAVYPLLFHWTMIRGHLDWQEGYLDRWCYVNEPAAREALAEWSARNFEGEPLGWHRHPDSGRRRPDGNPEVEYVEH